MRFDRLTKSGLLVAMALFAQAASAATVPRPDHIVIIVEENKAFQQIIGNKDAPYINTLAQHGALFTESYGITHPSQPNYLALFSGSTHNVANDDCLLELGGDNLADLLIAHNLSFVSYSESLPEAAYMGCMSGDYKRKHNPLSNWLSLVKLNQPYTAFPQDFAKLPTVALVVPNQRNDMHDGSIAQGDDWLAKNIDRFAKWALTHNCLLIVTWDEDNGSAGNHIATVFYGARVIPGLSAQHINHYTILHMISEMYGLPYLDHSSGEKTISSIWKSSGTQQ